MVFKVSTNRGDAFMKVARDENRAVIEVDTEQFLELWRGPLAVTPGKVSTTVSGIRHATSCIWAQDTCAWLFTVSGNWNSS